MIKRIDLRYRGDKEYPPEIAELVEKAASTIGIIGAIGAAERAAGVSIGLFGRIRRGSEKFSPAIQERVKAALKRPIELQMTQKMEINDMAAKPSLLTIPEACPELLADLIRLKGSKSQAWKVLGTSEGSFYKVINGNGDVPAAWIVRAKAALGQPVIGAPSIAPKPETAPAPQIPEFVPWDGKTKISVELAPRPGQKKGRVVKVPEPLGRLIKMHANMHQVGLSVGHTSGAFTAMLTDSTRFSDRWQHKVHRALHGLPPENGSAHSMGEEFDKYTLGIAICMMKGAAFDRIAEIAEILTAKMVFRKNTAKGWIIIYRMADEDLPKFKRLAQRDAEEIVCP